MKSETLRRLRCLSAAIAGAAGVIALLISGCGAVARSEAFDGPMTLSSVELERGRTVFYRACHRCHPGGEAGLGPALNDKPFPKFLMRYQIRHGLGMMPSFSDREISDEDVDLLLAYLKERKASG